LSRQDVFFLKKTSRKNEEYKKGGFIMYILFIGGIIVVALMPLLKGTRRNIVDSHDKISWDEARRIDQHIQQSKDKALGIFSWNRW
jgi:hypothetical protein